MGRPTNPMLIDLTKDTWSYLLSENHHDTGIHLLKIECRGRLRITEFERYERMVSKQIHISEINKTMGDTPHRPICIKDITPTPELLQLEGGSGLHGNICVATNLGVRAPVRISTFLLNRKMLA